MRGAERERAKLIWPSPEGRTDTPAVGTFFLWDGDQLTAEAPLHFGGHVDWQQATHWHYGDEASHTPIAKRLPDGTTLSIVSDHLGTPKEMFDNKGALVWAADHHVWGSIRSVRTSGALALKPSHDLTPAEHHCPFRFPGQYEDAETGLYYNRHRHYDALTGQYASPDPIGLAGGDRPQGYVDRPTAWCDPLGLSAAPSYVRPAPTASANWNTARSNYWKDVGRAEAANPSGKYSPANVELMSKGKAPRMTVIVRNRKTGVESVENVPIELHHRSLTQRGGSARANESWNLEPVAPWSHAGMDSFRHTGYDLIRIIRGPNSWMP
jgi:RHS repeat-associated protein